MHNKRLMGISVGPRSLPELLAACESAIEQKQKCFIFACANPHSLVMARRDPLFFAALDQASAVVADGMGCTIAGAVAGIPVGPRITGSDFFAGVMGQLNRRRARAFFFGSRPQVLDLLSARVLINFPNVEFKCHSPPYRQWNETENEAMLAEIREFKPDVLWVGMTAPKQEKWVAANALKLNVPVIGSIGAVFDYYAGTVRRAPPWVCDLGLEWLYRLPREWRRLWKRTLVSAPLFLWYVLADRVRSR